MLFLFIVTIWHKNYCTCTKVEGLVISTNMHACSWYRIPSIRHMPIRQPIRTTNYGPS